MRLSDFRALTFDCYGTLIDWESGMLGALARLTSRLDGPLSRNQILEGHARQESFQQLQTPSKPYRELLAVVYKRLAEEWGLAVPWEECLDYGRSVQSWPAFDDSADALRYLKGHFKLAILSNVDNRSFAASQAKLGVEFDAVYTAEDIGSYKPSDGNFEYMLSRLKLLGIDRGEILHTAESLFHDHVPANRHGLKSCWIHRRSGQEGFGATMPPADLPSFDFRFESLSELVKAHREEVGG